MSDHAVQLVAVACRNKFPQPRPASLPGLKDLPVAVRQQLGGHFGPGGFGHTWSGNIYNPTDSWTLEELTLVVGPSANADSHYFDDLFQERYKVTLEVPPLSSKDFAIEVNWPANQAYNWSIENARGYAR